MSYVATIKRAADKPPLTPEEIARLIEADASLSGGDKEPIVWTSPTDGRKRYINVATDHLWTDDLKGDGDAQVLEALDKLRSMARRKTVTSLTLALTHKSVLAALQSWYVRLPWSGSSSLLFNI